MKKITVCGLCNLETSCKIDRFPLDYSDVVFNFDGVGSIPSGVGLNVAAALSALGDRVSLISYAAVDPAGNVLRSFAAEHIADPILLPCEATPQSVILYDRTGRRMALTDLKDMQERAVPAESFDRCRDCDAFCLCNINYTRPLLPLARATGRPIFTDVHCLSDIRDAYNADFMKAADVLFLSHEHFRGEEKEFVRELAQTYGNSIIVVGMGDKGALLYENAADSFYHAPAVYTRPVVNTVGAGDALFSAFVHFYLSGRQPKDAIGLACRFASYKIGESGAANGFLSEAELLSLNQ